MSPLRRWTDEDLILAAKSSSSLLEICQRLGLKQSGPTNRMIRSHANRLGIELPDDPRYVRLDVEGDVEKATQLLVTYAPERLAAAWRPKKRRRNDQKVSGLVE